MADEDSTLSPSQERYGTFPASAPPTNQNQPSQGHATNGPAVQPEDDNGFSKRFSLNGLTGSGSSSPQWYQLVTVEPVILLFSLVMLLTAPINTTLYLVHTCVAVLGYNQTYCQELEGTADDTLEASVQSVANMYLLAASLVETCVPAVLTLFVGPWSDVHGRKTFLLLPVVGFLLKYSLYFVVSFYPTLPPSYLLLGSVPVSLSGGFVFVISLSYCYITDVTDKKHRGFRMGIAEAAFYTGLLAGTAASTYVFKAGGYVTVYAISAALSLVALVYGACALPESVDNPEPAKDLRGLFNVRLVRDVITTCCKRRAHGRRAILFLVVAAFSACVFSMVGESVVQFLFTREKFAWDIQQYTTFGTVNLLLQIGGTVLGLSVLSAWLGLNDAPLALISFALKIVSSILLALSPTAWWMYVASAFGMFGAVAGPLCRAILSKQVGRRDVGKAFSLLSSVEALTPLVAAPLYTLLYNATLTSFPGAFYLVSGAIFLVDTLLLGAVVWIQRSQPASPYTDLSSE